MLKVSVPALWGVWKMSFEIHKVGSPFTPSHQNPPPPQMLAGLLSLGLGVGVLASCPSRFGFLAFRAWSLWPVKLKIWYSIEVYVARVLDKWLAQEVQQSPPPPPKACSLKLLDPNYIGISPKSYSV